MTTWSGRERERDLEDRPTPGCVLGPHVAAPRGREAAHDRQPEPEAGLARRVRAEEALEQTVAFVRRQPGARVEHAHDRAPVGAREGDSDGRCPVLVRVVEQVDEDPSERLGIHDRGDLVVALELDRAVGDGEVSRDGPDDLGHVDLARRGVRASLLEPGRGEHLVHHRGEVLRVALDDLEQLVRRDGRLGLHAGLQAGLGGREHDRQRGPQLVGHVVEEIRLQPVELDELDDVRPLGVEQASVGDRDRRLLREQAEGAKVVCREGVTRLGVQVQHAEHLIAVHERDRHRAVDGSGPHVEAGELLRRRCPVDQERLPGAGDTASDPLADPDAPSDGVRVVADALRDELLALDQHDRAARALQQFEGAPKDHVEDGIELEHRVHRLARLQQQRQLTEPVGQRRREHPLVGQQLGEALEVSLLLDRVRAEPDRQQDDPHPERGGEGGVRGHGGEQRHAGAHRDEQDRGQRPQLDPPALHRLERRRAEVAQPDDPRLGQDLFGYGSRDRSVLHDAPRLLEGCIDRARGVLDRGGGGRSGPETS